MKRVIPYWESGTEWKGEPFFIKSIQSKVPLRAAEIPVTTLPFFTFLFLMEGEVLADIDGKPHLCRGGQFVLVPENTPFGVHYYKDITGYTGLFSLSFLRDASHPCLTRSTPVLHTFWFDEAAFVAELLDRVVAALARGDQGYITRALDLLLYCVQSPAEEKAHPLVNSFMRMIFDRSTTLDSISGYAARLNISPSYLNKLVRTQTRHSAMDWVEIARVNWAKTLLKDRTVPVSEVSVALGIDDPSYFTRFFRKETGMTPSEFRKKMDHTGESNREFLF